MFTDAAASWYHSNQYNAKATCCIAVEWSAMRSGAAPAMPSFDTLTQQWQNRRN